jgi:hypothetical protein
MRRVGFRSCVTITRDESFDRRTALAKTTETRMTYDRLFIGSLFFVRHLHIPKCHLVGSLKLYKLRLRY